MTTQDRRARDRLARERLIVSTARRLAEADGWDAVTTRRLAEAIEYSQPVIYSHFENMDAVLDAVALDGFARLSERLRAAREAAPTPRGALRALADAYLEFARTRPALYDAMFTLADLPFAQPETPSPLNDAFLELRHALGPFVPSADVGTHAEVFWSALHGLATLSRAGRLRPGHAGQRLDVLLQATARVGRGKPRAGAPPERERRDSNTAP